MAGKRPRLFFRAIRILFGIILVGWGIVSFIIFFLPGGIWTILLGLAVLAIDVQYVRRIEERLKAWVELRFPRFYRNVVLPFERIKEKILRRMK